jgi:serine protease Do
MSRNRFFTRGALLVLPQIFACVAFCAPLSSCTKDNHSARVNGGQIYTVSTDPQDRDTTNRKLTANRHNAITDAVAKASPAVVGINVTEVREQQYTDSPFGNDPFFRQFFGGGRTYTQKYEVKGLGSGFIISADGYILTNDHVAGNAAKIIVTLSGGAQYDAELVASDHTSDVALLKIHGSDLPFIRFGRSDDLAVGEWAIAMGNPFGLFSKNNKPKVTVGVISNTEVNLGVEEGRNYRGMIQTDAAISSGNSGGPLLNANGEVIGMNSTIFSTAQGYQGAGSIGLGFAIPINKIKVILEELKSGNKARPAIAKPGFRVNPLSSDVKQYFQIKSDDGVVVTDISRNSPADKAGLQIGDLITGVDAEQVRDPGEIESILADHHAGDVITLKVVRADKPTTVRLQL